MECKITGITDFLFFEGNVRKLSIIMHSVNYLLYFK